MIKTIIYALCTIVMIGMVTTVTEAQSASTDGVDNGFSASIFLGTNFSQLSGDGHSGFHLLGIATGARVAYPLSARHEVGLGLEYQQYGSNPSFAIHGSDDIDLIRLDYLSIPLIYSYNANGGQRYGLWLIGGLVYNRLFQAETQQPAISPYTDDFERSDLSLRVGISYQLGPHGSVLIEYDNAVTDILQGTTANNLTGLSSVAFRVGYAYQL